MKTQKEITRLENIKKYYKCTDEEVAYINQMINNLKTNIEPKKISRRKTNGTN